mmetsp:Transcript_20420/g.37492  ORF Transcript_20420/g.37492 Transcript_20420/m.37492 type:complete len:92 (-) Transcript_20420:626-901(-)
MHELTLHRRYNAMMVTYLVVLWTFSERPSAKGNHMVKQFLSYLAFWLQLVQFQTMRLNVPFIFYRNNFNQHQRHHLPIPVVAALDHQLQAR